jgi:hypothetical protein
MKLIVKFCTRLPDSPQPGDRFRCQNCGSIVEIEAFDHVGWIDPKRTRIAVTCPGCSALAPFAFLRPLPDDPLLSQRAS